MNPNKNISRNAGILIIFGIIAGVLSIVPSVESGDMLKDVYLNRDQVLTGAVFQLLLVPIYIGFSLLLYQVLSKYNKTLSLGFVGFRIMAGGFQLLGVIILPLFILLSQKHLNHPTSNFVFFDTLGEMLMLTRNLINHLGVMLTTGFGNLLLYYMLYKGKFVPIWLSLWGVVGNILIMTASFLLLFGLIEIVSVEYGIIVNGYAMSPN